MLKIAQYPQKSDGTPLDLEVGVLTDETGNNGLRLVENPVGPDNSPVDAKALILVDKDGRRVAIEKMLSGYATRADIAGLPIVFTTAWLAEEGREGWFTLEAKANFPNWAADAQQGIYFPSTTDLTLVWVRRYSGPADIRWFGAAVGNPDDTAIIQGVINLVSHTYIPAGTFIVSQITVPSNKRISTAGHDTIIQQKAGTGPDISIVKIVGSDVDVGSFFAKGNLGQAGEAVIGVATMTIANPGVVTRNAHGLAVNTAVMFRTTGALPTGLVSDLAYYVRNPTANTFELATRPNGASINTTVAQNGVHTLYYAGEHHHAVAIVADDATGDLKNITVGDIRGENIRGDVFMTYSFNGKKIDNWRAGRLTGKNVYRCIAAPCAGNGEIISVDGEQVGFLAFDTEPDGSCAPVTHLKVGKVKGRYAGVLGTDVTRYTDGVHIETLDLDPAHGGGAGSTPPYPFASDLLHGLQTRNCKSLTIGKFKANGFNGAACKVVYNGGELPVQPIDIREAEFTDCCKTEAVDFTYFAGAAGVTRLTIGHFKVDITRAAVSGVRACYGASIGPTDAALAADTRILYACNDSEIGPINTSTVGTGYIAVGADNVKVKVGVINAEGIFSYSGYGRIEGGIVTVTNVAVGDGSEGHMRPIIIDCILNGTRYSLGIYGVIIFYRDGHTLASAYHNSSGDKIIGARGAAVADAAALTSADAPALTSADAPALTSANAANAVAAPTKAEFDAFVAEFNKLRTDVNAMRTEFNKLRVDTAAIRTEFNKSRTDSGGIRTAINTWLARARAATGHGLIS